MELNAPDSPNRAPSAQRQSQAAPDRAEGLDSTPGVPRTTSVALPPPGVEDLEREFRVEWEIDVYAESPELAARKALGIHRNPESIATVFTVRDRNAPEVEPVQMDLTELDEPRGTLWWSADNMEEAKAWEEKYLGLGADKVELKPDTNSERVQVLITLNRGRANEIMGYEVEEEEWLIPEEPVLGSGPRPVQDAIAIPDCGRPTKPGTYLWGAWGQATEIVNIEDRAGELWQTSCGISRDARLSEFSDKGAWFGPIDLDQPGTGLRSPRVEPAPALPAVVPSSGEPAAEVGLVSALAARCRKVYDDALPGSPELQWEGYDWAVVELFQRIKETGIAEPLILLETLKGAGLAVDRYKAGENLLDEIHRAMDDLAGAAIHDVLKPFKEDSSLDFAGVRFVRDTWDNDDQTVIEIARVQVGYAGTGEDPIEWVDWAEAPGFMEDDDARHQLAMLGLHFVDYHTETYEVMV